MIENNVYNKLEILRLHMLINSRAVGILFYTLPIQENKNIKDIEIKNFICYFNPDYIENKNFEKLIINIEMKTIQFYFECDDYEAVNSFVIYSFMRNYIWFYREKFKRTYNENFNILIKNLSHIDSKKSTIIYCTNVVQPYHIYDKFFINAISNLSYDINLISQFNSTNTNTNTNLLIERCKFLFHIQYFSSLTNMSTFFKKYVHNFQHFLLFLFILRYSFQQSVSINFMRYHQPAFDILNIITNINIKIDSFKNEELDKKITKFFSNFSLEEKDWYFIK